MMKIYDAIIQAKTENRKLLAILLDPDKIVWENLDYLIQKIIQSPATHVFIGGSHVRNNILDELIVNLKQKINLPIVLFPGNPSQISDNADGILKKTQLEIISTGYMLIESGSETAVARVSNTKPLDRNNHDYAMYTAQAGEMLGHKLIYLEAGSGAKHAVPFEMIKKVSNNIKIPLIVGGGIIDLQGIQKAYEAGADLVVVGTAFENDPEFFNM